MRRAYPIMYTCKFSAAVFITGNCTSLTYKQLCLLSLGKPQQYFGQFCNSALFRTNSDCNIGYLSVCLFAAFLITISVFDQLYHQQ